MSVARPDKFRAACVHQGTPCNDVGASTGMVAP